MASKAWTLKPNVLCDLQSVKDELGIDSTVTTSDAKLTRAINTAANLIEGECNRLFSLAYVSEMFSIGPMRPARKLLRRPPILSAPSLVGGNPSAAAIGLAISQDSNPGPGSVVDSSQYDFEDPRIGSIFMGARFAATSIRMPGVVSQDYAAGEDEATYNATYWGGYITGPQVESTTASGSNAVNTGVTAKWAATTAYAVGAMVVPVAADTGTPNQLWICTTAGQSGGAEPSWGSPAVGGTKADGTATWTFAGGRSLPDELEEVAIRLAIHRFHLGGGDLDATSERAGSGSQAYGSSRVRAQGAGADKGRAAIPDALLATLARYKRIL